jgi:hypothetical protein
LIEQTCPPHGFGLAGPLALVYLSFFVSPVGGLYTAFRNPQLAQQRGVLLRSVMSIASPRHVSPERRTSRPERTVTGGTAPDAAIGRNCARVN